MLPSCRILQNSVSGSASAARRSLSKYIACVAAAFMLCSLAFDSYAKGSILDRRPLAIVRFSNKNVKYGPLVEKAVLAALQVKREAIFTLAGLSNPKTKEQRKFIRVKVIEMANRLQAVGVAPERILAVFTTDNQIDDSEMRIYVE